MKFALITDTHAGVRGDSPVFAKYQNDFYENVFFPECQARGVQTVVHGGDFFDRRQHINFKTLDNIKKSFLDPLLESGMKMYMIVGNHDVAYKNTNELNSPSHLLEKYVENGCVDLVDTGPRTLDFDGYLVDMVPWINRENYVDTMKWIDASHSRMCVGHFEFSGFEMHGGIINTHGMVPDKKIFGKYDYVLSGHFHTQSKKGNIQYIGNPFEFTWSDYNDKRGFWIFDTDDGSMEFIQNTHKMFYKIVYNDEKVDYQKAISKYNFDFLQDRFVRVIVKKNNNPHLFDLFVDKLSESKPHDLHIVEPEVILNDDGEELTEEEIKNANHSTPELIDQYLSTAFDGDPDLEDIRKIVSKVYNESLTESDE